jgi:hypothetical protein
VFKDKLMLKRIFNLTSVLLAAAGSYTAVAANADVADSSSNGIYAEVVLYDVLPTKGTEFEHAIASITHSGSTPQSLISDKVLRNIDGVTNQYATYSKFSTPAVAEAVTSQRIQQVMALLRRAPERHLVQLNRSYVPSGLKVNPSGLEFGSNQTGQIAHIGLFLPNPANAAQYNASLNNVKAHTVSRHPAGYLGDDLLQEPAVGNAAIQAPYTPRPAEPTQMSINYGEYKTLENAEDSYVDRAQGDDASMVTEERVFFSSLQVPTRFYIFQVVGNYTGKPITLASRR